MWSLVCLVEGCVTSAGFSVWVDNVGSLLVWCKEEWPCRGRSTWSGETDQGGGGRKRGEEGEGQ